MPSSLKSRSLRSLLWSFTENLGVAGLSLGSFIVLARLLDPVDFGVVALASVFIICFNLLISSALADGIIQRSVLGEHDIDTAFWGTLGLGVLLAIACVLGADLAAEVLDEPQIGEVLPWLGLVPLVSAIGAVPIAAQRRKLQFRIPALCSLAGRVFGAVLGVIMAVEGYGIWSLVAQQVGAALVTNLGVFLLARFRPGMHLSLKTLGQLWGFGAHVSGSQIVSAAGEQAVTLLVGTIFGSTMLGHFTVAWRMVQLVKALVIGTVYHVAFSAFSRLQEDRVAVTRTFLGATQLSCLVGFPLGLGMAAVASPAVIVLFGERWTPSIGLFAILALEMVPAFYVLFVSSCYRALGKPGWALGLAVAHFALAIAGTLAFARFGLEIVAAVWVAKSAILLPLHVTLTRRLLGASVWSLIAPAIGPLLAGLVMAGSVQILLRLVLVDFPVVVQLVLAVLAGVAAYAVAIMVFAWKPSRLTWRMVREMLAPARPPKAAE